MMAAPARAAMFRGVPERAEPPGASRRRPGGHVPVSSRSLVELVLLGPTFDRRQLQDTPILGDVWVAFASDPAAAVDLLIAPYRPWPAGPVAAEIARRLRRPGVRPDPASEAHVAYLQGIVAARLHFSEVVRVLVPMTGWWRDRAGEPRLVEARENLRPALDAILAWVREPSAERQNTRAQDFARFNALVRYIALGGLILWAAAEADARTAGVAGVLDRLDDPDVVVRSLLEIFDRIHDDPPVEKPMVWQVSLNRKASAALDKSVAAVKADAARTLFKVDCSEIGWAILDSGIDAAHPAFRLADGTSRVVQTLDFTHVREIVSLDNLTPDVEAFESRLTNLLPPDTRDDAAARTEAARDLRRLAEDAGNDLPIDWGLVGRLVTRNASTPPFGDHGTHVAGIVGASGDAARQASEPGERCADGLCPDIRLYDFRVLGPTLQDTEFAVIAALQYIRYLNERHGFISVHGANLSLSIPHDVRNFACGRTPICNECERLVDSGVVVVAAAGNLGYHSFETKTGAFEGYAAFSITDPGNADGVITVGATHRFWPHTYGVSFFSSRGPTGDGRMKPDLVAPGERIWSSLPGGGWGELDGTSMAAPHVSGAAAMLMARYSELIGQPRRLKALLCESATDLGRERSFQGHGMLDVLRAFQRT
jgi:serine protease AprX